MNIYEKLSAITAELGVVAKNLSVGEGRSSYKAVGEADVLAAVKPLEKKYGVYSYPFSRRIADSDTITVEKTYKGDVSKSTKVYLRLETVYRFVNAEEPGEYIDITTYGDGVDSQDKAPGKAMTYGDKYALLKAYKIITGEDPDQNASEEGSLTRSGPTRGSFEAAKKLRYCADCGERIADSRARDGSTWPAEDIAAYSLRRFDRILCPACQKAAFSAEKNDAAAQSLAHEDAGDRL